MARFTRLPLLPLVVATALPQQSPAPPPTPHGAAIEVIHLIDAIPDAARSSLTSPALAPPVIGEIETPLAGLDLLGQLADGRPVYALPFAVDRSALGSLRLEPDGPRPQFVAGSRFVSAERLAAFRSLKQRVLPDGGRASCIDRPIELKLPVDRMGPSGRLTLVGAPVAREVAAGVALTISGRRLAPRADPSAAATTTLSFDLPDEFGLTTAIVSVTKAGPGADELLLTGYELDEADGRDRAIVAASVDPRATRICWRPAPPAPILPLRASVAGEASSEVLLLPGRVGLTGVAPEGLTVETAGAPVRFERGGPDSLVADVAAATLARITIPAIGSDRPRAPLLLQPQACWLRPIAPMRGTEVAEPVHPLVDHWQVGRETRRAVALAAGAQWRVALPADAASLEFELGSLDLVSAATGSPPPHLVAEIATSDGKETAVGAVALPPAARIDVPARFDPITWPLPAPADAHATRSLHLRVVAAPDAPFTSQLHCALVAEPRVVVAPPSPDAPSTASSPASSPLAPRRHPNLLIYLVDTLRADRVHCLGNPRPTTPRVDQLAHEGILFTQARSQAPWTRPSIATLFTGLIPEHHTVTFETALPRAAATLAERMRAAGYETAAFTANAQVHAAGLDFEQGFDRFVGYQAADTFARSDEVVDDAIPWLDARADRPFFLYVHTIDPHDPYDPPPATRGLFEREYHGKIDDAHASVGEISRLLPLDDADRAHILDLYDEEIAFADREFGRLLDRLKELHLYDDTVILFLSDHGEELLDHGRLGHPRRLWNEVLHVPMVLRLPGANAPRGLVVDSIVRTMDWLPTLAALFGLPPGEQGFEGEDLAPAWSAAGLDELDAIAQTEPDLEAFQHGSTKLILEQASQGDHAITHLFDFASDPLEQHDLAAERPEVVTSMRRLLAGTKEGYAKRGFAPLDVRRVTHFDPEVERALRQLGYAADQK
jgi:arylsulfatase A-like enzyme